MLIAYLVLIFLIVLIFVAWLPYRLIVRFGAVRGFAIFILIIGAIYGGYKIAYPTYRWNQKLTITVDTPQGVVSGSSISKVSRTATPQILPDMHNHEDDFTGEAAFVDLGAGRYLFASLDGYRNLAFKAFSEELRSKSPLEAAREITEMVGKAVELQQVLYPELVTFKNAADPKSIEKVHSEHVDLSFGGGVKLLSISFKITEEPITKGRVTKVLPWLGLFCNQSFDGKRRSTTHDKDQPISSLFDTRSFVTGQC